MGRPKVKSMETPSKQLRDELLVRFRSLPDGSVVNVACGYMLKPGENGSYRDRFLKSVVMVMALRGQGVYIDAVGQSHRVQAGDMILMLPDIKHSVIHDADGQWAEFYVTCHLSFYDAMKTLGVIASDSQGGVYQAGLSPTTLHRYEMLFETIRMLGQDDWPAMWAQCHVILAENLRHHQAAHGMDAPMRRQMIDAASRLADEPEDRFSLPALAGEFGMSYESFRKHFKREMGLSPGELRIRRRMELAQKLIADFRLSIKETAYRLGYADAFTFSKQFKRYTGQSPRAFQQQMR